MYFFLFELHVIAVKVALLCKKHDLAHSYLVPADMSKKFY